MEINRRETLAVGIGAAAMVLAGSDASAQPAVAQASDLTLRYARPATRWTEALPIGNGRLGGMIWGGVAPERILLNEDTLWSGEPYDNVNPAGLASLPEIRRLLLAGDHRGAQTLIQRDMNGRNNQCYEPLGALVLDFNYGADVADYRRELDLADAVARVSFRVGDITYTREYFASFPDRAIVVRLSASQPGKISCRVALESPHRHQLELHRKGLSLIGRAPSYADPHYVRSVRTEYEDGPDARGMLFETRIEAINEGGRVRRADGAVIAEECDALTIVLVAATSYNGPFKSPSRDGRPPGPLCAADLASLRGKSFDAVRAAHVADHRALFDRVSIDLGRTAASEGNTDARIAGYRPGADPALAALYFQYGRYLLIASSRPGTQAANLQGIWNKDLNPAWSSNFTLNCNVQINYWAAEPANLAECHLPLVDLTEELSVDGAHVARALYGVRGWIAHHNADIWKQGGPVAGSAQWTIFQVGSAWLCQHLWEHYAFAPDRAYLERIWPIIAGSARFYLDNMIAEPGTNYLVTAPDVALENPFLTPSGDRGVVCMGPTGSMQMIRQVFRNCLEGGAVLGVDPDLRAEIEQALPRLPPMQVSPTTGELQEWREDWRGQSAVMAMSLWGAVCCDQITPAGTPALARALKRTFDNAQWWKQGHIGSWRAAFQANTYARLHDGETAHEILEAHLAQSLNPNLTAHFMGTEWQIDGNLGMMAAVTEMLLQSQTGEVHLLPALPRAWPDGSVRGLRARGGFLVDIAWSGGRLVQAAISSASGGALRLRYRAQAVTTTLAPGEIRQFGATLL